MVLLMIFNLLFLSSYITKSNAALYCEFATPSKYIGYFDTNRGYVDNQPYNWSSATNPDQCKRQCRLDDKCYGASFDGIYKCSLYNTSDLIHHNGYQQAFYVWRRCYWNEATQPLDGRCLGLFVRYYDRILTVVYNYLILQEIHSFSASYCLDACSSHPICSAINYNKTSDKCTLLPLWPHEYINEISTPGTDIYRWTCIPNFVNDLTLDTTPTQPNVLKCTGYWTIKSRNATLPNFNSPGVYFNSQSYNACLSECIANQHCNTAMFNVSVSMCVLPFIEKSDSYKYLQELTFLEFVWVCVKNDSQSRHMNDKEKYYVAKGLQCVKLVNNSNVYIAIDNCGHFPELTQFQSCKGENKGRQWTAADSCRVNQSFWMFPTKAHTMTINGQITRYATKIFTGLESFWIVYPVDKIYKPVSFLECRRFNGARSTKSAIDSEIILRPNWYALQPQGAFKPYHLQPENIVLTASQQPYFGCRTKNACISLLRNLQISYFNGAGKTDNFSDIPYNFMLDESGNIYEARGWHRQCAAILNFNFNSLCFAFIGSFANMKPPISFLNGVKRLIEFAVTKGHVNVSYNLYIHQDVTRVKIHRNFEIVIKYWYRYRGHIPKRCLNINPDILSINGVAIFIVIGLLLIMYRWCKTDTHCKRCNFLHALNFRLIYPKKEMRVTTDVVETVGYNCDTNNCIVIEKRTICFPNQDADVIKLVKLWFVNQFINSCSSVHADSDLMTYLSHLRNRKSVIRVYEAFSSNYDETTKDNIHVVICCTNEISNQLVEHLPKNLNCVCRQFSINFMTFSHLSFDTF